jgi:hypothetical protein
MVRIRRPERSANWAARALVIGALGVGPVVVASSAASSHDCTKPNETIVSTCTITGTATVGAGTLSVGASSTIKWKATLSGFTFSDVSPQTITAVDATGSGLGWNLTMSATPFTDSSGTTNCTAASACRMHRPLTVNGSATSAATSKERPKETCATGSTCTLPTNTVTYPVTVTTTCAASGAMCPPTTVANAAATTGMGAIDLTTDWWLPIPGNAYAGTYTDTITLTISSGP